MERSLRLRARGLAKHFVMHLRDATRLDVLRGVAFELFAGECVALEGPSGVGKSSVLRMIHGSYGIDEGEIEIFAEDGAIGLSTAAPRCVQALRRTTIGHVSQFLRATPRVAAIDVAAEPLLALGAPRERARARAGEMLERLNVPETLWELPPATFSGGERQRVNLARGFVGEHPILLLDEPTSALDRRNRAAVIALIEERKRAGAGVLGVFHDEEARSSVADRSIDMAAFAPAAP